MKKLNLTLTLILLVVVIITFYKSCSPKEISKSGVVTIPQDIDFVAALDLPKFLEESDFENLQSSTFFKDYLSNSSAENPVFIDLIRNPVQSGIDFMHNSYYALDFDQSNRNEHFAGVIFTLNNPRNFASIVKKHYKNNIKSAEGFNYILLDKLTTIGWNESFAIFGSADMFIDLEDKLAEFFNTKPSFSILENEIFLKAINAGKDLSFWLATSSFINDKELLREYGAADIPLEILEDNFITGHLDFGRGEMEGKMNFEFKEDLKDVFENYFNSSEESDFFNFIPKRNIGFLISTSLNLPGIYNYKTESRVIRAGIDKFLSSKNFYIDDFFRTFGGDLFAVSYRENSIEKVSLLLGTKFYNRNLLNKYLDIGVRANYLDKQSDDIYRWLSTSRDSSSFKINFPDGYPRIAIVDDNLLFMTDATNYNRILNGGYKDSEVLDRLTINQIENQMISGIFNADVMTNIPGKKEDIFEKVDFSFNREGMKFSLQFKDKKTYALKQLIINSLNKGEIN